MIPQDPVILLSYINTQLRDFYKDLDAMAEGLDITQEDLADIVARLEGIGYKYNAEKNKFVWNITTMRQYIQIGCAASFIYKYNEKI